MAQQIPYALRHTLPQHNSVLFYNHIPKCGGLSLTHLLRACFPNACDVHHNIFDPRAVPLDKDFYHGHGVSGIEHFLPANKTYYYITVLRHPWKLAQSLIRFFSWLLPLDATYKQDPETLLLQQEPNILIQYLGQGDKDKAEENLFENYLYFGLQEYFPASLSLLSEHIPPLVEAPLISKNVSTKEPWHISPAVKDTFYEKNALDIALYEKAQQEFFRRVRNYEEKTQTSLGLEAPPQNTTIGQSQQREQRCEPVHISDAKGATPALEASNTHGSNVQTALALKETIACKEDLPGMDVPQARFENWLFILVHSMQSKAEYEQYFHWLMQRASIRNSCLYFAFYCALKGQLAPLPMVGKHLFTLCQERDPHNHCRIFVQCRQDILRIWHEQGLYKENDPFSQKIMTWAHTLKETHSST